MQIPDSQIEEVLETLIDRKGLSFVLGALAGICWGKADHLRSNWQDETTAREWDIVAQGLDQLPAPDADAANGQLTLHEPEQGMESNA